MARKKRTPWRKRCDCGTACTHAYWLQVRVGRTRRWINLDEMFPDDSPAVAATKAREMARAGKLGAASVSSSVATVADVATLYRAKRTCKNDVYVDHFVASPALSAASTIGAMSMDTVTTADVKHACGKRVNDARRHFLQAARHLFNWAIHEGYATRTPFKTTQGAVLIKVPQSNKRTRRLEAGEDERIRAVGDAFINDFLTAMLATGCRPGELRTLQWSEVSDDRITVLAAKAKTRKSRKLPILPELRAVLEARRKAPDGSDLPADAFVFGDDTGRLITRERLCERWRVVCGAAKVVGLHLHDLRGEFASMMAESGVPTHLVRDTLGHSSLTMTNTYLRSRTDSLDDAFAQLQRSRITLVKRAAAKEA
jgi:integrase